MSRSQAAELARETLAILETGEYRTESGVTVLLKDLLLRARKATESFPPDARLPVISPGQKRTRITVENASTLAGAFRLVTEGHRPLALNFASAQNPGGGFQRGAQAQEESLARSSGLYPWLVDNPMYEYHRSRSDATYSSYAIYSPEVPVFRDDDGKLLEQTYCCGFITAPAVNAKVVLERDPLRLRGVQATMAGRIFKVLTIAALKHHDALVLGAWGCGVFGNDRRIIAELFRDALTGPFQGVFSRVVFAVIDPSSDQQTFGCFQGVFREHLSPP